jgi:hypothetical protein
MSLQAWDVQQRLLANSCKPTPIITITTTVHKHQHNRHKPAHLLRPCRCGVHISQTSSALRNNLKQHMRSAYHIFKGFFKPCAHIRCMQVWDAHQYLLANPCKPTPIITITTTLDNKKAHPKDTKSNASTNHGSRGMFKITVTVRDAVTRMSVSNAQVTLALDPSNLVRCSGSATRSTGKKSGAVWSCKRSKGGAVGASALTISATSTETKWYAAAAGEVTVQV